MFEVLGRSWRLTKLSFGVIMQDKEMLLFPLLAGIFSILFGIALVYPTIVVDATSQSQGGLGGVDYLLLFVTYLGLAFIATFFNVCVVYTTKTRFEGGDATFMDSIRFAMSRVGLIFGWSLVSATVGLLLRALDALAERMGGAGEIIMEIVTSILGLIWSVITLFVIPTMVYEGLGPIDAIKRSASTLKRTWGESLVRHYGLGLAQLLFLAPGIAVAFLLFGSAPGPLFLVVGLGLAGVYCLAVILVFSVANQVFNTALYAYAQGGQLPADFDADTLHNAFRHRRRRAAW